MKATYLEILVTGIATFALSLLVHKLYIRWANLHGIGAIGGGRHVHSGFVPVVGGMSFFTTFILVFLPVYFFYGHLNDFSLPGIFAGMIIVHALGVADDIKGISPGLKFAGSALAAALYVMTNRIAIEIYFPLIGIVDLGVFAPLFNIVWIMGIINATNLLDGIDGLAGGIFVIATLVITFFAWQSGDLDALFLMAIMMASVVGFLRYNYHPARVFMGDGGSLLLGFLLGVMPLRVLTFDNGFVNYTILLSILLLPFLDTATAFIRRMLQGRHPFYPDKEHLHHRLLTLGARVPQATLILWFFSALFGGVAIMIARLDAFQAAVLFIGEIIFAFLALSRLGYFENRKRRMFAGRNLSATEGYPQAPIIINRTLHYLLVAIADVFMILLAEIVFLQIKDDNSIVFLEFESLLFPSLLLVVFWVSILALNKLYDISWDTSYTERIFRIAKVTFIGVVIIFLLLIDRNMSVFDRMTNFLLYWITLVFLLSFGRVAINMLERRLRILEYAGKNCIIIGSGDVARRIAEDSENRDDLFYNVIGLVDDLPCKECIGEVKDLPQLIYQHRVEEIIIAGTAKTRDDLFDIIAATENLGVKYKITPEMYNLIIGYRRERVMGYPLIRFHTSHLLPWQKIGKRIIDIAIAITGLILGFIPAVFYGLYTYLKHGRLWHSSIVIGRFGRPFFLLQFASLVPVAERETAHRNPLEKWPFLVHVLLGQMSMVGPRLEGWRVAKKRILMKKRYRRRYLVKPGIVGLAQIKAFPNLADFDIDEQIAWDVRYQEEMSVSSDLVIMLRSVFYAFSHYASRVFK
jgi:UDP-GlcNAc:undecaprenyl-phosphate GlcNAc-1-phosphate transferase